MTKPERDADSWASRLFPGLEVCAVVARAVPGDDPLAALDAQERELVARAVPKRQRAFGLGRRAAHAALAQLGAARAPLLNGADRAPIWPRGVVGSISHADDIAVAVAAHRAAVAGVGVDIEQRRGLDEPLWRRILRPTEAAALTALPVGQRAREALVVFCAKEAVYKAWYPLGLRVLEFGEVETSFAGHRASFVARVEAEPFYTARGCVVHEADSVLVSAWLEGR